MKLLRHIAAWGALVRLFLDAPALFRHLHGLAWYRGALRDALPDSPAALFGQSVLEIGCAAGDFCGEMSELGATVHGMDRSEKMLARARTAHPQVQFKTGDATALPYYDNRFDVVYAASLLNVVDDPVTVLREMARVCRPGGALALLMPAAEFNTAAARQWLSMNRMTPQESAAYLAWHLLAKKVSAAEFRQWIAEAGLGTARIETHTLLGGLVRTVHIYPAWSGIPMSARQRAMALAG